MPYDRQPILGKTRDLLADNWEASNVNGIGPSASEPLDLTIHTRGRDAQVGNPQLSIELVDETQTDIRIGGDGSGPVMEVSGVIQVAAIAGSRELLVEGGVTDANADVSYRLAQEVKRVWHEQAPTGLFDTSTGELEYDQIAPGSTSQLPPSQLETNPATTGYLQELRYEYEDRTPP